MFAWSVINDAKHTVQVKPSPELIPALIENNAIVRAGYHMNKRHWITIVAADCDASMLRGLLEDAHSLVIECRD